MIDERCAGIVLRKGLGLLNEDKVNLCGTRIKCALHILTLAFVNEDKVYPDK